MVVGECLAAILFCSTIFISYEHCWSGNTGPNSLGRLTINQRVVPAMVERMLATAPAGADTSSWRY